MLVMILEIGSALCEIDCANHQEFFFGSNQTWAAPLSLVQELAEAVSLAADYCPGPPGVRLW